MTSLASRAAALLVLVCLLVLAGAPALAVAAEGVTSLAEAKALAAESGKPILLDFATEW
jgi:hypothetical protein